MIIIMMYSACPWEKGCYFLSHNVDKLQFDVNKRKGIEKSCSREPEPEFFLVFIVQVHVLFQDCINLSP